MIGIYHRSNFLTFLGIAAAGAGISLAVRSLTEYCMLCLVFCGICDLFDGAFARSFKRDERQKAYGVQLDSLADLLSFGLLPVMLLYSAGIEWFFGLCVTIIYFLAAVNRLAFFNMIVSEMDTSAPVSFYRGLPVTYASLAFPVIWMVFRQFMPERAALALGILSLCLSLLYVLDIKVPKPRGAAYIFFILTAVTVSAGLVLL